MRAAHYLAASATLAAITLAGCSSDLVTSSLLQPGSISSSVSADRPLTGECTVNAVFTGPANLTITGWCQLTHLGSATVTEYQTIVPRELTPWIIDYTNIATYTSSNGDELHTTNVGVATAGAEGLTLTGVETVVGGTGRFANASGTAMLSGAVHFTGPASTTGTYSLNGRLNY